MDTQRKLGIEHLPHKKTKCILGDKHRITQEEGHLQISRLRRDGYTVCYHSHSHTDLADVETPV